MDFDPKVPLPIGPDELADAMKSIAYLQSFLYDMVQEGQLPLPAMQGLSGGLIVASACVIKARDGHDASAEEIANEYRDMLEATNVEVTESSDVP